MESTDFWAQIVQLTAVLALALVLEIRAMHQRVQTTVDKPRTKFARGSLALMYALAVLGLTSAFYAGLSGMTGASIPDDQAEMILWALIFTFFLLVAAPTIPLIWALIDDLPFSPDGVARWNMSRLRTRVDEAFVQADRAGRSARLDLMGAACLDVVAASKSLAAGDPSASSLVDEAMERFTAARQASPELARARDEIELLLEVLAASHDFTTEEATRWRAAADVVRAAGGHSIP